MSSGTHISMRWLALVFVLSLAGSAAATSYTDDTSVSTSGATPLVLSLAAMEPISRLTALKANPVYADLDGNGSVGLHDFAILRGCLLGSGSSKCSVADYDGNGSVDDADLAIFKFAFAETGGIARARFALVPEPNTMLLLTGGLWLLARAGHRNPRPERQPTPSS
ncbi:PEP-CTERM sorting domain-containing protein [Myxococcota bacterium]|nr:PEP-CTERM sorting domain-containing protein [Myxococcota bacterium]